VTQSWIFPSPKEAASPQALRQGLCQSLGF
jgi:hypothetical protein